MNNIVDNVIRELEFKAGLTLASFGLQAELKAIQNYLNKESIDEDLKEACHISQHMLFKSNQFIY